MISSVYGGFWRRAVAIMLDQLILLFLSVVLFFLGISAQMTASGSLQIIDDLLFGQVNAMTQGFYFLFYLAFALAAIIYFTFFISYGGQTPGKMVMGLYVLGVNGEALNIRRALLRGAGYLVSGMPFYLGFLWVIFDRRKQGWHDKMAGSIVVHIPRDRIRPAPPQDVTPEERPSVDDGVNFPAAAEVKNNIAGDRQIGGEVREKYLDKEKGI